MKKKYILLIALLAINISFAQFVLDEDTPANALWSTDSNWDSGVAPGLSGQDINLGAYTSIVDEDWTVNHIELVGDDDVTLTVESGNELTFTHDGSGTQDVLENDDPQIDVLTLVGDYNVVNSGSYNSRIRNQRSGQTLTFDAVSKLTIGSRLIIINRGTLNLNGEVVDDLGTAQSGRLSVSSALTNLTAFNHSIASYPDLYFYAASSITGDVEFNAVSTSEGTQDISFFGGPDSGDPRMHNIIFNAVNSVQVAQIRFDDYSESTLTINATHADVGVLRIDNQAIVNLDIDASVGDVAGEEIAFDASNNEWNIDGELNITGLVVNGDAVSGVSSPTSNLRFGTDQSALTTQQMSQMTIVGSMDELVLSELGYVIRLSDLETAAPYQDTKTFTGAIDTKWSTVGNWDDEIPGTDPQVLYDKVVTSVSSTIDNDLTIRDIAITGDTDITIDSEDDHVLTMETQSDNLDDVFVNQMDEGIDLTIDAKLKFLNNVTTSNRTMYIRNQVDGNILNFGSNSDVHIGDVSDTNITSVAIASSGVVNFEGTISGTNGRIILTDSQGTCNFNSRLAESSIGEIRISSNNTELNFDAENVTAPSPIENSAMILRVTDNRTGNVLNFSGENCVEVDHLRIGESTVALNITADQENIGQLRLDENAVLNLDLNTNMGKFGNSSTRFETGSVLNVTGFVNSPEAAGAIASNLYFGPSGLSTDDLAKINFMDSGSESEVAVLTDEGYVIFESTLSVHTVNAIEFSMYPNPVEDILRITSEETIDKIEVLNLVGTTVVSVSTIENGLDVSSLTSGVYILRLSSSKGISTAKFVKK